MEISVVDREDFLDGSAAEELVRLAERMLSYLGLSARSELCVSIVSDVDMRELNRRYRKVDATTDVLSFAQENRLNPDILGDVVISYETAVRRSRSLGIGIEEELRTLLVHAVLHLLGFDHKKKKEREAMREKEREILNHLAGEGRG